MTTATLDNLIKPRSRKELFETLCKRLTAKALACGQGEKLPTVAELSASMGVSVVTLSRALDELERRQVIVRKHGIGVYASPNAGKRLIAVVCDPGHFRSSGSSPFWDILLRQASARAEAGCEMLDLHFGIAGENGCDIPSPLRSDIESGRLQGVVGIGVATPAAKWIEERGVPFVAYAGISSYRVEADIVELIQLAVHALALRGCTRIGLAFPYPHSAGAEMSSFELAHVEWFRGALEMHGLSFSPAQFLQAETTQETVRSGTGRRPQEFGFFLGRKLFNDPDGLRFDGLVSMEDMITLGLLDAARAEGVEIGRDFHVATQANVGSPMLLGRKDSIISVEVDPAQIVELIFTQLERLMAGEANVESRVFAKYTCSG